MANKENRGLRRHTDADKGEEKEKRDRNRKGSERRSDSQTVFNDGTVLADETQEGDIDSVEDTELGFVRVDLDDGEIDPVAIDIELPPDEIVIGTNEEAVMEEIDDYTDDEDVLQDFAERQSIPRDTNGLLEELLEDRSKTPGLSGGDVDASWETADQSGEETVGGSVFTPDQDVVDELGGAVGVEYDDDEPLHTYELLENRDRRRWELDPASAESELEDSGIEQDRVDRTQDPSLYLEDEDEDEDEDEEKVLPIDLLDEDVDNALIVDDEVDEEDIEELDGALHVKFEDEEEDEEDEDEDEADPLDDDFYEDAVYGDEGWEEEDEDKP